MVTLAQENQIEKLVEEVVRRVQAESHKLPVETPVTPISDYQGVYGTIDQAVQSAEKAYQAYRAVSLEGRKHFIAAMRKTAGEQAENLAAQAVAETGLGRVEAKIQKNLLAANKTPGVEDITPKAYTGDHGLTLVENAPFGVVGAITPTTNPAATIINNSISILAAGNAVVFNPHPAAKQVTNQTISLLNQAIEQAGGPACLLNSIENPTLETSQALMKHPQIRLLLVTGGGAVVKLALTSGKRCIAAGPGNPPVIVDDTASLTKAARCIVDGASFDNNILCTAEKEVLAFDNIADGLISEMQGYGAYLIRPSELDALVEKIIVKNNNKYAPQRDFIGKDASRLLEAINISCGREIKLVICEVPFEHPLVQTEMLMPILPIVRVDNLDDALDKAKKAEHGYRHTALMHSESVSNMSRVAREIETTIFVKNAPSYAGLGFGGEGFCTLSIAGPTGEGLTSARSFTRQRRCVLADSFRII
jgi:propionaldehyde dehydrogenase